MSLLIEDLVNELDLNMPPVGFRIFALNDTDHLGRLTLADCAFTCRICGLSDKWKPEGGTDIRLPRSWVCEHKSNENLALAGIREIDSIPHRLVGRVEILDE